MCGIVGILNRGEAVPVTEQALLGMLAVIQHRGPDGCGIYRDQQVGLGSARLSILDLEGGDQPIGNEDGSLWIVFNGEIFNYLELRSELEELGHRFSTRCDTEVILHLYEEKGPGCLKQLNGQFALAIWNSERKSLFLARDRVGVRPLYYSYDDHRLVFGSEIKALLTLPEAQAEIDLEALRETFNYWSPLSPRTIFRGIQELPPASWLIMENNRVRIERFWDLNLAPETPARRTQEYLDQFEGLLSDAVRLRLRADVPVGAYLSGGVDSAVITALVRKNPPNRLETFSIAFSDPQFDESQYQQVMAAHLGTEHQVLLCEAEDIGRIFPEVIWHAEAPLLRTAPAPMYMLSGLVHRAGLKVVLTGEGADEFLAGYDIFKEMKLRRFWARCPDSSLRPMLLSRLYPDIQRLNQTGSFLQAFFKKDLLQTSSPYYSHSIRWSNTARSLRLCSDWIERLNPNTALPPLPDGFDAWPELSQAQYLEITTFLSPYLLSSQGDRMGMAHSVEGRYPFLDVNVMEFCNRLPPRLKMPVLSEKWLLKLLAKKYVPEAIWRRVKRPYRAPIQRSFFGRERPEYVSELLSARALSHSGLFKTEGVERLVRKASGEAPLSEMDEMALVGILSTQLVDHFFVQRKGFNTSTLATERIKVVDRIAS